MQTHNAVDLKGSISGLFAPAVGRLSGTLKFRHVRYRTFGGAKRSDPQRVTWLHRRYPSCQWPAWCAPDHVVLELADLAVGVNQLPHHFDNAEPAFLIHRAHDDAGEMIEID